MNNTYTKIKHNNQTFYLIGTAHVSKISALEVSELLDQIKPESICIELDENRYNNILKPNKWEDTNIIDIIKRKQTGYLLVNIILSSFQKRVASKLNSESGKEMIIGIEKAKEYNSELVLADRDIKTTFMRIWRKHTFLSKTKLLTSIIMSIFTDEDISEDDINNLKQSDMLESALNDIGKDFPIIKDVLVDERDTYLANKIKSAKGESVVAILGAAHLPGVIKNFSLDTNISELDIIPNKSLLSKLSGYIIPLLIISIILFTLSTNTHLGIQQMKSWILFNGTFSAIGVLIALGHPLSIMTAFVAAPITSLNPLLAAGWFAGIVEAMIRKPTVKDFNNISESTSSIKSFYNNRLTRILLVVILANLFSTIGTIVSGLDIVNIFLESVK